jgi:hypothetical protein
VEAIDDDDRRAPQALRQQRGLDVRTVLVAVADDEGAGRVENGERDQQLGLAARLEADVLRGAVLHDLFDHVALLVDLDGIDAPEAALVTVLADRLAEGGTQPLHTAGENVGQADQKRRPQTALVEILHQIE